LKTAFPANESEDTQIALNCPSDTSDNAHKLGINMDYRHMRYGDNPANIVCPRSQFPRQYAWASPAVDQESTRRD
jgi:hypothetical protein